MMNNELPVVNIRMVKEPSLYSAEPIETSNDAAKVIGQELKKLDREVFGVMNVKSDGSIININIVSMGTLNSTIISPRDVFKSCILSNAAGFIAFHNHPSGKLEPSMEDIETTQRLSECGKFMDIKMLDHIIVSGNTGDYVSLKQKGYIDDRPLSVSVREKGMER